MSFRQVKSWNRGERTIKWMVEQAPEGVIGGYSDIRLEMTEGAKTKAVLTKDYAADIIWERFKSGMSIEDSCRIMLAEETE